MAANGGWGVYSVRCSREKGRKWGVGGVLSQVLEENGGKWGLGGVLNKVLEENGGKSGLGVY